MTPAQPFAAILILAAGQSQRMRGADKMLEVVRGLPLIRRQAQTALATGLPVSVALTPTQPLRAAALADLPITVVQVTDAENGISRSIVAGNAAIHPDLGLVLLLADLPDIETADLISLLDAARRAPDSVVRATTVDGKPGHPVYFPARVRGELAQLRGDEGARDVLKRHAGKTVWVALPGRRALTDLDTPEDWALWRAAQKK